MDEKILRAANLKLTQLRQSSITLSNIILDNWRGYRFIYDTPEVRACNNDCQNCPLYKLLKDEPNGAFTAGLKLASSADKKIFGLQRFLNCKTAQQYANCYTQFVLQKTYTKKDITEELELIQNFRLVYTKKGNRKKTEQDLKRLIISKALSTATGKKKAIIAAFYNY